MGYYKDNFPGSPAALQRNRLAKYVVAYSVVIGGLLYTFSPFAKAQRQAVKEGAWDNPEWFDSWKVQLNQPRFQGVPKRKDIEKAMEQDDKITRGDFWGPALLKKSMEQPPPSN